MTSLSSLSVGIPWVLLCWASGVRKAPVIHARSRRGAVLRTLAPIGFFHAVGLHASSVIALGGCAKDWHAPPVQ